MNPMVSSKVLDLKTLPQKSTLALKKGKDEDFKKELDKKEKESGKKDFLSPVHEARVEDRAPLSKSSQNESRDIKRSSSLSEVNKQVKNSEETVIQKTTGELASLEAPLSVDTPENSLSETLMDDLIGVVPPRVQENAPFMAGSLALEGMELTPPQALELSVEAENSGIKNLENSFSPTVIASNLLQNSQSGFSESDLSQSFGEDQLSSDMLSEALNPQAGTGAKANELQFDTVIKAAVAADVASSKESNVDNVVQSARTLIKDGGGEMQIKLNPEGLGTVNLKVGVQSGEVTIEILAQDNAVKKMFEDGMADIRNGLELQNLKMDHFKVDVSQQADSQLRDQQQENAQREFARDFMNQFRGERQAFRNQDMSYDMERSPDFSRSPEGLSPARTSIDGNGRLNIVA